MQRIWRSLGKKAQWFLIWLFHPKFNIGVSIIIPSLEGKILLGKHVFSGTHPWRLIGGYTNRNENIYDAAKREAKEELGIDITIERVLRVRSGFSTRIEITLVAHPIDNPTITLKKNELEEIGWFAQGSEPEATLASHKELIALYKRSPRGVVKVTNL
jgi:8-oxo-dGTP diphosphatase